MNAGTEKEKTDRIPEVISCMRRGDWKGPYMWFFMPLKTRTCKRIPACGDDPSKVAECAAAITLNTVCNIWKHKNVT